MLTAALSTAGTAQTPASTLPPALDAYLATVHPTRAERNRLHEGGPVTKLLEADPGKEVAVFGAVWIDAPMGRYVEAVKDVERWERGPSFVVTKRLGTPPALEDFALLHLNADDFSALRRCRMGECDLKLGREAVDTFQAEVDWKAPGARLAADRVMQRLAHEYVTGYLEGGNSRLAVYRDRMRPTLVAEELRGLIDQLPPLSPSMPELRAYLLDYPNATLPNATSLLYWQETVFGLKPTIRISHMVIREGAADTLIASKMLYASHYFWAALELRALIPDPSRGTGFWLVTVNRSRTDGLTGFTGLFVRRRARSAVQEGTLSVLQSTKRRLESAQP